jgi:hypothetical protein
MFQDITTHEILGGQYINEFSLYSQQNNFNEQYVAAVGSFYVKNKTSTVPSTCGHKNMKYVMEN